MQLTNSTPALLNQTKPETLDLTILTKTKKSTKASTLSKKQKKKGNNVNFTMVKMTRPLNSWIAFRSYYAVIFTTMPQKVISGFLTHLWKTDPTKAKWTILAKAYSELRDKVGKKRAPLSAFLAINAPFVGVIDPDNYLRIHGWEIIDRNSQTILRRADCSNSAVYGISTFTTNASVEDVIRNSCYHGYINEDNLDFASLSGGMSLIMAASAQPVGYSLFEGLPIFNTGDTASTNEEAGNTASSGAFGIDGITSEASTVFNQSPSILETAVMNLSSNGIDESLMRPNNTKEVKFLNQKGTCFFAKELEACLHAAEFDLNDNIGNASFQPDMDNSFFDPFNNNQFDAFHLSDLNCSQTANWTNDSAF